MDSITHLAPAPSLLRRIVAFPLTLMVIGFVWIAALAIGVAQAYEQLDFARNTPEKTFGAVVMAAAVVLGYKAYKRWVERVPDAELPLSGALPELAAGLAIGTVLFSAMTGIVALLGGFEVLGLRGANAQAVVEGVRARLAELQKTLPEGVKEQVSGIVERLQELVTGFGIALLTGILLMYVVLVLLFKSFIHPITIQAALPLAMRRLLGPSGRRAADRPGLLATTVAALLPDAIQIGELCDAMLSAYDASGVGPAMARFMGLVMHLGPIIGDVPGPDPAAFGFPMGYSGTRGIAEFGTCIFLFCPNRSNRCRMPL